MIGAKIKSMSRLGNVKLKLSLSVFFVFCLLVFSSKQALAQPQSIPFPHLDINVRASESPGDVALTLQIIALITILSLAPAIVLMVTSFTRILIVLGFVRQSIGLQQLPPNQVLVTLALFLTFFTMSPVWQRIYTEAVNPYIEGTITTSEAYDNAIGPLRNFMFYQVGDEELSLMVSLADLPQPESRDEVPTRVLIPAFMLGELKKAFQMGILIFIPFIVVDMIVASILLSMGMIMLPPMLVSLPFKVLLFVVADGWDLVIYSVVNSFK